MGPAVRVRASCTIRSWAIATVALPIPTDLSLVGMRVVGQGVVLLGGGRGLTEAALVTVQ